MVLFGLDRELPVLGLRLDVCQGNMICSYFFPFEFFFFFPLTWGIKRILKKISRASTQLFNQPDCTRKVFLFLLLFISSVSLWPKCFNIIMDKKSIVFGVEGLATGTTVTCPWVPIILCIPLPFPDLERKFWVWDLVVTLTSCKSASLMRGSVSGSPCPPCPFLFKISQ